MKGTKYVAHQPDKAGHILWSENEDHTWSTLIQRQKQRLRTSACSEYLIGIETLNLPEQCVPQLTDIDGILEQATGWHTEPVPALINFSTFFDLLSRKRFPVATFIRSPEELDYLQEPDIFHEVFGHCPLLTHPAFARFTEVYGQLGLNASKEDRVYLARLYWFTVEFGLLRSADGAFSIYGGGILSSPKETEYALHSEEARREPFDLMTVLRTPYRIDILQPVYFYLNSLDDLFDIANQDIMSAIDEAKKLGLLPAPYTNNQTNTH